MARLQAFPSISVPEFADACRAIEERSADRLSGTDWLSVKWTGSELLIRQRRDLKTAHRAPDLEGDNNAKEKLVEELIDDETVSGALQPREI